MRMLFCNFVFFSRTLNNLIQYCKHPIGILVMFYGAMDLLILKCNHIKLFVAYEVLASKSNTCKATRRHTQNFFVELFFPAVISLGELDACYAFLDKLPPVRMLLFTLFASVIPACVRWSRVLQQRSTNAVKKMKFDSLLKEFNGLYFAKLVHTSSFRTVLAYLQYRLRFLMAQLRMLC